MEWIWDRAGDRTALQVGAASIIGAAITFKVVIGSDGNVTSRAWALGLAGGCGLGLLSAGTLVGVDALRKRGIHGPRNPLLRFALLFAASLAAVLLVLIVFFGLAIVAWAIWGR